MRFAIYDEKTGLFSDHVDSNSFEIAKHQARKGEQVTEIPETANGRTHRIDLETLKAVSKTNNG